MGIFVGTCCQAGALPGSSPQVNPRLARPRRSRPVNITSCSRVAVAWTSRHWTQSSCSLAMRSDTSPCLEDQRIWATSWILQFGAEPSARDGLLTGLHQEGVGVLARIALGDPVLGGGVLSRLDPPTAISKTSTPWRPVVSGGFVCREQYVQHYCCISRMAVL